MLSAGLCKGVLRDIEGKAVSRYHLRWLAYCPHPPALQARKLDHSPTFVTRTLPSGSPRTETLSSRAAAYKPDRHRLRLRSSVPTPRTSKCSPTFILSTRSAIFRYLPGCSTRGRR